jgi:hypothetical protein
MADDDWEPFTGRFDWDLAFEQNPDAPVFDVPDWEREINWGRETVEDAQARAVAREAEGYARIAHLDL